MANKRVDETVKPLTGNQQVGNIAPMAETAQKKPRGGQLKASPVTFYPPSPEFREKIYAVAEAKGRTASNFINHMIEKFMETDPDAIALDKSR